ncbi:MAG TPA: type II toxin-antitoxin system RelE/ParE family toxin [Spirochaetota bacterium]|nr:type II toxin-antitoxin system RelE/ParE family toxin [Bacilli bacterium]HOH62377.1 type II toxin-antitoxin system RelE/ParE family toxin [Bacilli bacterium]HPJ14122.1 type II toxin-antitoxin system RelE/ParE family toxin [Spirochaetota bacterium]HPM33781.1 type II toxin-antitoxin system RelE/ParE family toxin [Spirochaetota bacterium]
MMMKWKVIYYSTPDDKSEVFDFIESLLENNQVKVLSFIQILSENGPNLPRPYADLLIDGIHELRIKLSGNQIRILYFFCYKEFIILTNSFVKTTDKVPIKEINKSKKIRDEFINRFSEEQLRKKYNEDI